MVFELHAEEGGGRAVDQSQTQSITLLDLHGPRIVDRLAVHQVARVVHVDVERFGTGERFAAGHRRLDRIGLRLLVADLGNDALGRLIEPIGHEDGDVLVVVVGRPGLFDDVRPAESLLFLQAVVRVVPVGPGLNDRVFDEDRLPRSDRILCDLGHAVHVVGHEQAVPVHGARDLHGVVHKHSEHVAFGVANLGAGIGPVDEDRIRRCSQRRNGLLLDVEHVVGFWRCGHAPGPLIGCRWNWIDRLCSCASEQGKWRHRADGGDRSAAGRAG